MGQSRNISSGCVSPVSPPGVSFVFSLLSLALFLECIRSVKVRSSLSSFSLSLVLTIGASSSPNSLNASYGGRGINIDQWKQPKHDAKARALYFPSPDARAQTKECARSRNRHLYAANLEKDCAHTT